jgi:molybdopterin/thiamine biosynthesis adenylyltransferase
MKCYIIGAGGTASYLLPVLVRSITVDSEIDEVIVIDRDELEEKNVERQNYEFDDVGKGKAEVVVNALRDHCRVPIKAVCDWFTEDALLEHNSFIVSCTDNHPARLAVLRACDEFNCKAVICGNEDYSADAYYYEPKFEGTPMDPRVRYDAINTDRTDDPTRPPCNDADALEATPQLAAANSMSATLGMHLVQLWLFEIEHYDLKECFDDLPIEYSSCKTGINTLKAGQTKE